MIFAVLLVLLNEGFRQLLQAWTWQEGSLVRLEGVIQYSVNGLNTGDWFSLTWELM